MIRSMFTAIGSLKLNQSYMDVIADNLANANTNGFKANRFTFQSQYSQLLSTGAAPSGWRTGMPWCRDGSARRRASRRGRSGMRDGPCW